MGKKDDNKKSRSVPSRSVLSTPSSSCSGVPVNSKGRSEVKVTPPPPTRSMSSLGDNLAELRQQWAEEDHQQIMNSLESRIERKLSEMEARRTDPSISPQNEKVSITQEIYTSLKFDLDELNERWEKRFSEIQSHCNRIQIDLRNTEAAIDNLEQYSRRQCLLIHGIDEQEREDPISTTVSFLAKRLDMHITAADIVACHRLQSRRVNEKSRSRPLIVKFVNMHQRDYAFNNKRKLKGSAVMITESLTSRRKEVFDNLRRAKVICWTKYGEIFAIDKDDRKVHVDLRNPGDLNSFKRIHA